MCPSGRGNAGYAIVFSVAELGKDLELIISIAEEIRSVRELDLREKSMNYITHTLSTGIAHVALRIMGETQIGLETEMPEELEKWLKKVERT